MNVCWALPTNVGQVFWGAHERRRYTRYALAPCDPVTRSKINTALTKAKRHTTYDRRLRWTIDTVARHNIK